MICTLLNTAFTYHVICDQFQVSAIDIDLVNVEYTSDFTKNSCSGRFNTVRSQDGVNVVRVDAVLVNQAVHVATRELPEAGNV